MAGKDDGGRSVAAGRRRWTVRRVVLMAAASASTVAFGTLAVSMALTGGMGSGDVLALVIAVVGLVLTSFLIGHEEAGSSPSVVVRPAPTPQPPDGERSEGDLVVSRDLDGCITATSDSLWRLLGRRPGAFVGMRFAEFAADLRAGHLLDPADIVDSGSAFAHVDPWRALRRRLLAVAGLTTLPDGPVDNSVLVGDLRVETIAGPRWFFWCDEPVVENGVLVGRRARGHDITARKAIEAALEEARDEAQAASAAKSRFLAMVSHEIRTPLNGILGMTGLLMQTQLSPEQKTYARAVETSGEALLLLIEDLLDFSKIEAGRLDLQPSQVNLQVMVEELVELLAPRAYTKGIELAAYIDPALPETVIADPVRLRQVLFNLAGNGIKFTAEGGVAIEVLAGGEDPVGNTVTIQFQVRDTGIGIAPHDQERIFGEFEQADPGPARAYGGTGLGLAIARQLVRLMGGDIGLQSASGAGACFAFTLRFAREPGPASEPVPTTAVAASPAIDDGKAEAVDAEATGARAALARLEASFSHPAPTSGPSIRPKPVEPSYRVLAGHRILVVSHALIEGPMVLRRLFDAGADVTLATQKDLEVELAGSWRPDVILVDTGTGDAVALIDRIRSVVETPVGVLISPSERPMLSELQAAGYGAYLVKPVRARSLIAAVRALIGEGGFAPPEMPVIEEPERNHQAANRLEVLLCDDNEINLLLGRSLMERLGHRVTVAADGQRAIQLVGAAIANGEPHYDVILMDLHMPEVDGIEAARRIRALVADAGASSPRIVALTADAAPETREGCEDGLFDDWLSKPLQPDGLEAALDRAGALAHAS